MALSAILYFSYGTVEAATKYPLDGAGTEDSPYIIGSERELRFVHMRMLESRNFSEGKFFLLTADIRLNGAILDGMSENLMADTTALNRWTPIGTEENGSGYREFKGIFDGNGHTVYGMYVNSPSLENQGLFRVIGKGGAVRNLRIADSFVRGGGATGAICGTCTDAEIADCESTAMIVAEGATHQGGGIAGSVSGYDGRLLRCINRGVVTGLSVPDECRGLWNCETGGISGNVSSAKIDSCANYGKVCGDGWGAVGGVTGSVSGNVRWCVNYGHVTSNACAGIGGIAGNNSNYITGCVNYGTAEPAVKGTCVGGIVGVMNWNSRVYDSVNSADISTDVDSVFVGGIVGNMNGGINYGKYYTPEVHGCANGGNLQTSGRLSQVGGISGKNYCADIFDCENHGRILSASLAGGISPLCEFHSNISGCGNTGSVGGDDYAGGIVGDTNGSVSDSWNRGNVGCTGDAAAAAGGIAGYSSAGISKCFNTGVISHGRRAGGIAGNGNQKMYVSSCYNDGLVHSGREDAIVAGISAGSGTVADSYNTGLIEAEGTGSTVAGIAYNTWVSFDSHGNRSGSTVENCYNMGMLHAAGAGCRVGNISGSYNLSDAGMIFKNCYYLRDAIEGDGYTTDDDRCSRFTAVEVDGFKTLADRLNVREWEWDEYAFVQGYYRPVLAGSMHYKVSAQEGAPALLDLGRPTDNTVFLADTAGMVLEACNVLYNDTVRRAVLVDGMDFHAPSPFVAGTLEYSYRKERTPELMCLPFAVDRADAPEGSLLMRPRGIECSGRVLLDTVATVGAGVPFALLLPEDAAEWRLEKACVGVSPAIVEDGYMAGTFACRRELGDCDYVPTDIDGQYRKAVASDSLKAFRSCLHAAGVSSGTLTLDGATGLRVAKPACRLSVCGRHVTVEGQSGTPVSVRSLEGFTESEGHVTNGSLTMAVGRAGVYFITVGTRTYKVFLK